MLRHPPGELRPARGDHGGSRPSRGTRLHHRRLNSPPHVTSPARGVVRRAGDRRSQLTAASAPQAGAEHRIPGACAHPPLPPGSHSALPRGVAWRPRPDDGPWTCSPPSNNRRRSRSTSGTWMRSRMGVLGVWAVGRPRSATTQSASRSMPDQARSAGRAVRRSSLMVSVDSSAPAGRRGASPRDQWVWGPHRSRGAGFERHGGGRRCVARTRRRPDPDATGHCCTSAMIFSPPTAGQPIFDNAPGPVGASSLHAERTRREVRSPVRRGLDPCRFPRRFYQ